MPDGDPVVQTREQSGVASLPAETRQDSELPAQSRIAHVTTRALPWLLFTAIIAWGWRTTDLFHKVPAYGDVLEGLWALTWYDDALRLGFSPARYPLVFHPVGWYVATYAWGPAALGLLFPLYRAGGAAFAYNVATLLTFLLAFAGTYTLGQRFVSRLGATVAALLFTFWGFRWYSIIGQLNISLATALLPWMLWSLERGLDASRRSRRWYVVAGVIWAACINSSLYFLWIGGLAVFGWLLGRFPGVKAAPDVSAQRVVRSDLAARRRSWFNALLLVSIVAGIMSIPELLAFLRASRAAAAPFFTIYDVNVLGASANSLPIPYLWHPWLGSLAQALYHGPSDSEAGMANLGLLTCVMAIVGLAAAWRTRAWRPVLILACLGLILALGLTLKWDDRMVQVGLLRPLNRLIWRVGDFLKPGFFFVGPDPPGDFRQAVPLPGLLLSTLVPYFEGARVFARYAFVGGLAVFLLAAFGLDRVRYRWIRLGLAGLLIFEVMPPPTASYAFPPPPHPAFEWLQQQSLETDGIAEFYTRPGFLLGLPVGGEVIWATRYHHQATVAGASSVWPGHTAYLMKWLSEHPHPFRDPEFVSLLRSYRVRYVLLHMHGGWEDEALDEARQNGELRYVQCFPSVSKTPPWDRPICVLEVLPSATPNFNVLFREGWSGPEDWGRWVDGTEAQAEWVATSRGPHTLSIQAFPQCVDGRQQRIFLELNGAPLTQHQWAGCETWSDEIAIPPDLVRVGSNELTLRAAYGARPVDLTGGENTDPRALSVGLARLRVDEGPQESGQ
jgi:hypothetical protein